ncbi:MAG: EFR1 family ferrodoxin [Spirochaetaceae bacterium]|nr:EFR1 family ferrodoxin [Spirochaetaceae bacterium]
MKKTCIFIFSGTGMTKYVIDKIKRELEIHQVSADIYYIENVQIETVPFDNYDSMGIAYPIHSFNAPKIVIDFAKKLPKINSMNTFIISIAGDISLFNLSSSRLLIKILSKKGFNVFYDKQFIMPSNFIVKDDEAKVKSKLIKISEEIPKTIHDIINLVFYKQKNSCISNIMTFIGRIEWIGLLISNKFFYASKECISCAICVDNCPNNNISIGKNHAYFHRQCGLCMRCLYLCPRHCIKTYRLYKFISFDKWYENDELSVMKIK